MDEESFNRTQRAQDDELNRVHYVLCLTVYLPAIVFALVWAVTQ